MKIRSEVNAQKDYIIAMRRHFHSHPEESLQEFETATRIEQELDAMGIEHRRVGQTGVVGFLRGELAGGKVMLLRADTDALPMADEKDVPYRSQKPGVMHACGHDGHTAALLGAARVLCGLKGGFGGEVRLVFQQAEEIGQGARLFVQEGLLDGVERVFGIHVVSQLPVGQVIAAAGPSNASCDYFKITVKGKKAHVSTPHLGVDALYVAAQIVVNVQSIASRMVDPFDPVVVGIGTMQAGSSYNILADEAVLEGTTRSFSPATRAHVNAKLTGIATQIAQLYGAQADVEIRAYASPLINHENAAREVQAIAGRIVGEAGVLTQSQPSLGADDFAEFLLKVPGVYAFVGTANENDPNTRVAHHNGCFDIDEEALLIAAQLHVDYALQILQLR